MIKISPRNFLLLLAATAAILTGFFIVQNQQLKNKVSSLEPTPTPDEEQTGQTPAPTTKPSTNSYTPGAGWTTKRDILAEFEYSICLPPKWVIGEHSSGVSMATIYFARDANYRPIASFISIDTYDGGSRRDQYINSKLQYEPNADELKAQTTVTTLNINGRSMLEIKIPSFPAVIIQVLDGKLVALGSFWDSMVNDSQSAFRKDILTVAGCIKPL